MADKVVDNAVDNLVFTTKLLFSVCRLESPFYIEKISNFIYGYGRNNNYQDIGRSKDIDCKIERYPQDTRIDIYSRKPDIPDNDIADCAANELRDDTHVHNVYLFHRQFSVNRERFGQEILPGLIQGAITEIIGGCKSKETFDILKNLVFKPDGVKLSEDELQEKFTTADELPEKKRRLIECNAEIELFKNVIRQLNKTRKTVEEAYNRFILS